MKELKEQTPKTAELVVAGQRRYVPNYAPKEIILDRGEGARVWDTDGNEYVDLGTGISVSSLGHGDPELAQALSGQAGRLWHASNLYFAEPAVRLAEELCEATFADRVFFCNSGAEANEAAIKLARRHASLRHGPEKREIVTFHNGFHGRTPRHRDRDRAAEVPRGLRSAAGRLPVLRLQRSRRPRRSDRGTHLRGARGADPGRGRRHPRRERLPRHPRRTLPGA